jgi:hypothetical protein
VCEVGSSLQEGRNASNTPMRGGSSRRCLSFWLALAKGSGGSRTHSDITVKKLADTATPKMMSAKPTKKMKPAGNRTDPYKNYKFR